VVDGIVIAALGEDIDDVIGKVDAGDAGEISCKIKN